MHTTHHRVRLLAQVAATILFARQLTCDDSGVGFRCSFHIEGSNEQLTYSKAAIKCSPEPPFATGTNVKLAMHMQVHKSLEPFKADFVGAQKLEAVIGARPN